MKRQNSIPSVLIIGLLSIAAEARTATVAYWPLDDASGALVDVVGGWDLSAAAGLSYAQPAVIDPVPNPDSGPFLDLSDPAANPAGIDFSATSSEASSPNSGGRFALTPTASFTFEGFLRVPTEQTAAGINGVIGGTRSNSPLDGLDGWMVWMRDAGRLGFVVESHGTLAANYIPTTADARVDDNQTHHFALIWDHDGGTTTAGRVSLYLDGTLYASVDDLADPGHDAFFMIGWRRTAGEPFPGTLDELRFSDAVLAPEDFLGAVPPSSKIEIGVDDFRISESGPDGDPAFDAFSPAVGYAETHDEFLVVWAGRDDAGETEIFGQRIDAISGNEIGNDFAISDMGPNGDPTFDAFDPAVAYNPIDDEYLVVWSANDDAGILASGEFEIYGQRLDANPASFGEVGVNDFRISDMGADGDPNADAHAPDLVHNPIDNEFVVVWFGDDVAGATSDEEFEIFGQRIDADAGSFGEVGVGDFRISDMGPDGDADFDASEPAIVYNSVTQEILVVWSGDDDTGLLVSGENEIFGQRLDARSGSFGEIGAGDFRISQSGPDGNPAFDAFDPAVAHGRLDNEYVVVWHGQPATGGLAAGESEIFAQRLDARPASFGEVGVDDLRISSAGPDGDANFFADEPRIAYNAIGNQFLVVWSGDDDRDTQVEGEVEIHAQCLDANPASFGEIGPDDARLSHMGTDGSPLFDVSKATVAFSNGTGEFLVAWSSDDDSGALVLGELEIFGQRIMAPEPGFAATLGWSALALVSIGRIRMRRRHEVSIEAGSGSGGRT